MSVAESTHNPTITLIMNKEAVDTILLGLAKLPLEIAYNLFEGIRQEKEVQLKQFHEESQPCENIIEEKREDAETVRQNEEQ